MKSKVLNMIGTVMIVGVLLAYIPIGVPEFIGYKAYAITSGSMEPAMPVGSLIYVKKCDAEEIVTGDVIAFNGATMDTSIVTHRVVEIDTAEKQFITKGDANESNDINPIPFDNLVGKVTMSFPVLGKLETIFASGTGKIAAVAFAIAGMLLTIVAGMMEPKKK